jgi:hypothetical protein
MKSLKQTLALLATASLLFFASCGVVENIDESNPVEQAFASGSIETALTIPDRNEGDQVDYYLKNDLYIYENVKIEPGVIIAVEYGYRIEVIGENGSLTSIGTQQEPIIIKGTQSDAGHWMGIQFQDVTSTLNQMKYTEVYDGGNAEWNEEAGKANVFVKFWLVNTSLNLEHCKIGNSGGNGLVVSYGDHNVDVSSTSFENNLGLPIRARNNIINNLSTTNSFSNNGTNAIEITGLSESGNSLNLKRLPDENMYYLVSDYLELSQGCDIEPGVKVQFTTNGYLWIEGSSSYLNAVGTPTLPIVLQGTESLAGMWNGVIIRDCVSPKNQLEYVTIKDGGKGDLLSNEPANLTLDFNLSEASASVNNCTFENSRGYGIAIDYDCVANGDNTQVEIANTFVNNQLGNVHVAQ